jgi:electron transfer flavoprotein beta subunit
MRILVGLKQVPDDTLGLPFASGGQLASSAQHSWMLSPFDRYAIEEALRIRDATGGEVVVAHVGPDNPPSVLTEGLALGADRAVHVWDATLPSLDPLATARALAGVIRRLAPVDLILCGQRGVGEEHGQIPGLLAELLDLPQVTFVVRTELLDDHRLRVEREVECGREIWETSLPAVLSAQKGLNEPRQRSLKGVLGAKKKPIDRPGRADLALTDADLEPQLRIDAVRPIPPRGAVRMIPGDPDTQARELVRLLREEGRLP